jgi:hypothetical protein
MIEGKHFGDFRLFQSVMSERIDVVQYHLSFLSNEGNSASDADVTLMTLPTCQDQKSRDCRSTWQKDIDSRHWSRRFCFAGTRSAGRHPGPHF